MNRLVSRALRRRAAARWAITLGLALGSTWAGLARADDGGAPPATADGGVEPSSAAPPAVSGPAPAPAATAPPTVSTVPSASAGTSTTAPPSATTGPSRPEAGRPSEETEPVRRRAFDGSVALGGEDPWERRSPILRRHLPELVWDRSYSRFGIADAIVTGLGGATTLAMAIIPPIQANRRTGGIGFDEDARNALRAPGFEGRYLARDSSDVILSLSTTYPFFVDALVSAWWFRGNADVARQMALIDAEAFAITGTLQGITNVLAARERPYGRTCGGETPEDSVDCASAGRYRSFFSGHAAFTFTAAGLICSHHMQLDLLGNKVADISSCVAAYLGAGAAATLRVVGDMHYASDVILGAVVGTSVGLAVPWFHYHGFRAGGRAGGVDFHLVPAPSGASVMGTF